MRTGNGTGWAAGVACLLAAQAARAAFQTTIEPLGSNDFDTAVLDPQGRKALDAPEFKWKHSQTKHFVLHYEHAIFMQKVGRMAEFFYEYISTDLRLTNDLLGAKRSHIFIFDNKKDWETFRKAYTKVDSWAVSFVHGPQMYLQKTGVGSEAGETLGHEMTHLVVNRFLKGDPPLAVNEGVAEWYGEFAYAAFKGVGKSRKLAFGRMKEFTRLNELLRMEAYPRDPAEVRVFYQTAKNLVGFLLLKKPPEKFAAFLRDCADTPAAVSDLLLRHYQAPDLPSLEDEFRKFVR